MLFEVLYINARVAQLVEHDLAKVGVAGSNPVSRSTRIPLRRDFFLALVVPARAGWQIRAGNW